ncbi:MAG: hypothetical protein B7Z44_05485 [Caulobacter sp. 12-67-6]|nr:MAG: hypothetical protein B7Z44_05485 [Caulobacter sp. 12-67-6]OYX67184.1 MAG: hypothetical protein B7Y81_19310 [Caulobacter sp. 32-67-35]OZA77686.1 MAG: hypothetical protein B7X77_04335 [Caulobacter sp. 39-67-4]HQR87758.1 hypothetical protein [Caulobacter sp.]
MTQSRPLPRLAVLVAAAGVLFTTAAMASDHGLRGGPPVSRGGLPLDPELLPPNTGPGDCVTRRVTGPGGAYRWDRVECEPERGWTGFDPWGYGRRPLEVETLPSHNADRYSGRRAEEIDGRRRERRFDAYAGSGDNDSRAPNRPEHRYGPGPSRAYAYRVAGRDADGFLVWPGKQP